MKTFRDKSMYQRLESSSHGLSRAWLWLSIGMFFLIEWAVIFQPSLGPLHHPRLIWGLKESWRLAGAAPLRDGYTLDQMRVNLHVRIWVELMLAQSIVCGAMMYHAVKWIVALWGTGAAEGRVKRTLYVLGRAGLFTLILVRISSEEPRWNMQAYQGRVRTYGTGVILFVVAGFLMITMWVIQSRVLALDTSFIRRELIVAYVSLRYKLQVMLSLLSLLLVAGIAELVVRRFMITTLSKMADIYPGEVIVMRGIEYSVLIATAYLPIHASVNGIGCRIRDRVLGRAGLHDAESIQEWSKQRTELDDALQLKANEWKSFGPGFAIFAPVVMGMLASLVKTH